VGYPRKCTERVTPFCLTGPRHCTGLGIQAFQPKLIEGKAIQLHPLVCTAFNADFDGDQMAVHLPLGNAAILEAQILMLASHNILNPANGAPITVPSQDMVLGLYYMTKAKLSTSEEKVRGEGLVFYSPEEVNIAYNEGRVDLHASSRLKVDDVVDGEMVNHIIETTVGRVLFNEYVPEEVGFINELLTKKSLRDIIGRVLKLIGTAKTADFLDVSRISDSIWRLKAASPLTSMTLSYLKRRPNSSRRVMNMLRRCYQ
jgi:DNA-directed RNA polymerase subunit beta'